MKEARMERSWNFKSSGKNNLEVAIIGGQNLDNLKNYIEGKKFEGSIVK